MTASPVGRTSPAGATADRRPRRREGTSLRDLAIALPWIAPALLLILGVVIFPAGVMFYNSTRDISQSGVDRGGVGFENFQSLLDFAPIWGVLARTLLWVVVVVTLTVLLSLALAQLLDKAFPGRQLVRMAVIIPWAASVVMTTLVVYYGLDPFYGIINEVLVNIGVLDAPYGWTKNAPSAFAWSIAIAVFVSLPFTTYTILAGLQTVPADVLEAARMDGAGRTRTYFSVILPQLRSALAVAILINIINVFNSLPILKVMTGSIPGYEADTIMTLIFKYIQTDHRIDVASALSVVGFLIVLAIVAVYVRVVKPMREV
ncbi:carbohydrate ABC transporter permease [Glaciihabitans arcticus]|uniref:carbohydrate ABC transporter permease n=1 Tax=Glaciihabitans arcticus TaxID=2668039 RepID=UPI001F028AE6|nr:sugar ABC transporter permease [Glaciihabitans arcticus]